MIAVISINNVEKNWNWTLNRLFRFQITENACLSLIDIGYMLFCSDSHELREFSPENDIIWSTMFFAFSFIFRVRWLNAMVPSKRTVNAIKQKMNDRPYNYIDTCSIFRVNIGKLPFIPSSSIHHRVNLLIYSTLPIHNTHKWTKFDFGWKQKSDVTQCFFFSMLHIAMVRLRDQKKREKVLKKRKQSTFYSEIKS